VTPVPPQVVFAQLMLSHTAFVVPRSFWFAFKDYDGQPIDLRDHQDAYEFFTRLQDSIDQHLKSSGQMPAIQAVVGGKFAQQIICKGIDYTSEREEEFYQISVDVRWGRGWGARLVAATVHLQQHGRHRIVPLRMLVCSMEAASCTW
jgi:hypothetical protein